MERAKKINQTLLALMLSIGVATADSLYCYDGDTCYFNDEPLRLLGVDTPELPSQEGYLAKYFVNDWLATADNIEIVFSGRRGYYGRQLVDIYIDGQNLSKVLIERGYGEVYE